MSLRLLLCAVFYCKFTKLPKDNYNRTTIDTPQNRESMADADKSEWLPPEKMSELIRAWADGENRPINGSFAKLNYKNGVVLPEFL